MYAEFKQLLFCSSPNEQSNLLPGGTQAVVPWRRPLETQSCETYVPGQRLFPRATQALIHAPALHQVVFFNIQFSIYHSRDASSQEPTKQSFFSNLRSKNAISIPLQPKTWEQSSGALLWSVAAVTVSNDDHISEVPRTGNNHLSLLTITTLQ